MKTFHCFLVAALSLGVSVLQTIAAPTVTSVVPAPGTVSALTQVTVNFSGSVANVVASDLLLNGFPLAGSVTGGGAAYTFVLAEQPGYGTVAVSWDPGHNITDAGGAMERFNENGVGATWQYTFIDTVSPTVVGLTPSAGASVRSLTQVDVQFNEAVTGVEAADLLVNNVPASGLSALSAGIYRFTFAQPANGQVQMAWAGGHGIRDLASPANNFAGGAWTYTLNPSLGLPALRINEFVAANISGLVDENNEPQDWIEIWNYGASPVNLNGFSLSDDPDLPGKWVFPSTNLAAGQFLVVFASEKDRRVITNAAHRLHTNFKLNPGGEYLGLFNSESPRVAISEFAPEYPEQRNNYSFGYDTGGDLKYFLTPTPGAANGTSAIVSILPAPHFNVSRGLFDQPFELILSSTVPGAIIRYTVDGSEPTESAGLIYSAPLTISNTAVLRAVAFKANSLPSATVTHSYFFIDQVVQQPIYPTGFPTNWGCCGNINDVSSTATFPPSSTVPGVVPADYEMDMDPLRVDPNNTNSPIDAVKMQRLKDGLREIPTLSIVMKLDDIFGTNGLHQRSADETGSPGTKPDNKKPCSVELILPNGETAFATTCGIDLHGNASRNPIKNPKHGFKLNFRGDFGPTTLQYRLFEDSTVEEFDDILLRADFNSSWRHWSDTAGQGLGALQRTRAVRTRDAWMKDSMREMGGLASHNRFVHLYLNGLYWGTYDISEDTSPIFAKNALGGSEEDYDVVDQGLVKNGTSTAYSAMTALPAATSLAAYEQYNQYLNMPEFIDYMVLHFFMGHQDWGDAITKNWAAVRKRVAGSEGTFRYVPWDGECILLSEDVNRVTAANPPSGLHTKLDDSPEYRLAFADRVHRSMVAPGGALTPSVNIARWQKWQAVMDKAIVAESVRWGDYRRDVHRYSEGVYQLYTRENHWLAEHARMLGYFSNRNATVLTQLRNASMYPTVSAPVFNQQGGLAARGFNLAMTATNSIYYTLDGSDPRVYGTGAVSPGAALYAGAITLSNSIVVKARALFGTNWSALNEATFSVDALASPLRITEIMYNPVGGDAYEFIEIKNVGTLSFNVGNYTIDGVDFVFPPNTVLAPGQVIVLGSDTAPTLWTNRYPGVAVFGRFGGRLDNGGERLGFRQGTDPFALVWSVDYNDESGWPLAADGQGASLEMIDPFGDPDDATNWRASVAANGTPGVITPPPPPSTSMVINEIVADNGLMPSIPGFYPDWVELYNRGSQNVNLANWSLSDNSNPRRFVFPATNVPPGGYVFAWMGAAFVSNELVIPFGLGSGGGGENLFLYDANTNLIDSIGFGFQLTNYSLGRVNNEWVLTQPTPKTANVAATLSTVSNLSINEWLANPDSGDDWIELHNRGTAPVALRGIFIGAGTGLGQIKSLSFLAPGGFVQFLADGNSGVNNLPFSLPAVGGSIVLYAESGVEIDRVTYGPQAQGVTQGRLPDGAPNITSFPASPSPSASNYLFNYTGPTLNEVLAINDAAVVNAAGRTADFVELRNPNGAPFDVSGMRLSTDPDNASQWTIPAGVSIPANGYLVIWFDDERPASLVNEAVLNTGRSLDGDSDEVWLFNSVGQPVDSVVFGFQVADKPIGRSGSNWDLLMVPTPGNANAGLAPLGSPLGLRINEWQASPLSGNDWFEIYNTNALPVALAGLYLADNPSSAGLTQFPLSPLSFIGAKGFVECIADGAASQGRNHVNFSLEASGEMLRIVSPSLGVIDTVGFGLQQTGVSEGRVPDGGETVVAFGATPTPGASNYRPLAGPVINEVLSYPVTFTENAIELFNPTGQGIDLGGWYLSDSAGNPRKYRIADGTFLPAGGYVVFYEAQWNPGASLYFDAYGGQVMLSEADAAGNLTGNRSVARFEGALAGVSFGRVETCAGVDFVALSARTFGQDAPISSAQFRTGTGLFNAPPRVGPVVINEIMYHPPDDGTNDNTIDEYIELHNFSASPVQLFDPANPANTWQLREGVRFNFPNNVSIPAGGYFLIVSFDPVSNASQTGVFRTKYGVPQGVPIFGPYSGRLDNGGERVELYQPVPPPGGSAGTPFVLVDRIEYGDSAPWPTTSDGAGESLQRVTASAFGNDAANWTAASPTAGAVNPTRPAVAPTISVQPLSRAVPTGSRVIFSVGVCGSRPLTYQWKRNGNNLTDATNASYVIPSAQVGNAGDYTVLVGNSAGSVLSAVASLSLVAPPVITTQPTLQSVAGGMLATFSVVATGSAPLTYQWRRNGLPIAGATNATLMLESVRRNDAGDYSVLVGNAAGAVASATARLTVLVPPTITAQPQNQSVTPGSSATFSVAATGVGTLRYQWQFNGVDIPGATGASFTTNNVQLLNEGNYRVLVTDDVTTGASAVARLTVRVAPLVLASSPGVTNVVGSTITMSVVGSGSVPMGFIWRRGAAGVVTNVLMTTSNSFTITNAQVSDTATWRVILTNSGNMNLVVNTTFVVRVVAPPQITGQPTNQVVERGANATFAVSIGGTAPFQYQWRLNGNDLPGATNATLTVTNVQFANLGSYQVFVSNLAGNELSQPATLSLVPEPTLSDLTRLVDGTVQMRIFGPTNRSYAIEASSTLTNWTTLNTIFYTNGLMPLSDSTAVALPHRFYRARLVP